MKNMSLHTVMLMVAQLGLARGGGFRLHNWGVPLLMIELLHDLIYKSRRSCSSMVHLGSCRIYVIEILHDLKYQNPRNCGSVV